MKNTLIRIAFLIVFTANAITSFAQSELNYIALSDGAGKKIDQENFKKIDTYFDDVKIAGLGESTHGTSEFHIFRAELFKYLVVNKDFNTLFLEADYADCILINDYVAGKDVNIREAMKSLNWPWQTEELLSLIDWMRAYNQKQDASSKLQFIGIDGQWSTSASKKLNNLLLSYELAPLDSIQYPILSNKELLDLKKRAVKDRIAYVNLMKEKNIALLSQEDQQKYQLLIRNIEQCLGGLLSKCSTFRDTMMGQNMLEKLQKEPDTRAIFWAHNQHIVNVLHHYDKKRNEQHGRSGGILKQALQDQYVAIMQDFDSGSFIAYYKTNDAKKMTFENANLGKVTVEKSISGSYGEKLRPVKEETIFIDLDKNDLKVGKYKGHTIGAVFSAAKENPQQTSQFNYCPGGDCFDAVIFTKESSPIQLITK